MIPGKDLVYAGTASLGVHLLAILITIVAGSLFSPPGLREKPPGLSVSLVTLSPLSPSPARESGAQAKSLKRNGKKRQALDKPDQTLLFPSPGERQKKAPSGKKRKVAAPDDSQTGRNEMALYATLPGTTGGKAESGIPPLSRATQAREKPETGTAATENQGNETQGTGKPGAGTPGTLRETGRFATSRYRETPPPVYPETARHQGHQGLVLISVEILESGSVGQLLLKKSSGHPLLDQAALQAVKKWKFVPAVNNNVRIRTWGDVPVRFVLQDFR